MVSVEEQVRQIEEEIRETPYNKATQHHIGKLKAKLARLREKSESKKSGRGYGFGVKKSGDATVVLVGFPSVGKSTLLSKLTNAKPPIGSYDFTTIEVIPGMMKYKGLMIQLLDLPGVISGASLGRGGGREVLSIVRNSDLVLIMLDVNDVGTLDAVKKELHYVGIRLDEKPPKISIKRTSRGGISINSGVELKNISERTIVSILNEYSIHNAIVSVQEDVSEDKFIDAVMGNRAYISSIVVVNKIDNMGENFDIKEGMLPISAENGTNLETLREIIFEKIGKIRIFMKKKNEPVDMEKPLIMKKDSTIGDICDMIHKDIRDGFRYARVWGKSVKHPGQRNGLEHVLKDGDVVTLVKRN